MSLETGTYLDELVVTNPVSGDNRSDGDDHLRLIKSALKSTLPGLAGRAWRLQSKSSTYTAAATDNMSVLQFTSTATLNLPAAATAGNGYMLVVTANSGVTVTIDPDGAELVKGAATFSLEPEDTIVLYCTGAAWMGVLTQSASSTALTDSVLTKPRFVAPKETFVSNATATGAVTLDCATAAVFTLLLTGNVSSLSFSNVPSAISFMITLAITQDATGSRTFAWPGTIRWASASAPTVTATANKTDVVSLLTFDGGSNWFGFVAGQNF